MNIRLLLAPLFLVLAAASLSAQTFRPLSGYEDLQAPPQKGTAADKMEDCNDFSADAFILVTPGETRTVTAFTDTTGLGPSAVNFNCEGCGEVASGTIIFTRDSLIYSANAGATLSLDTVLVNVCNDAGSCSEPLTFVFLVRRAGREIDLPTVTLDARAERTFSVPTGDLPGGTTCRTIEGCSDTYGGRSQRFTFVDDDNLELNNFTYQASGYGGTDEVCVTICNDFGICDTYRQRINVRVELIEIDAIPFFDDFSYGGSRPSRALWQDEDVLINTNFAQEPPTVGVATFDAVSFAGFAYPPGSGGRVTVVRDYLTSAPIRLNPGQTNLELNFFVQPRGLGNRPETQDSFLVQFLAADGEWRNVHSRAGLRTTVPATAPVPFEEVTIPVRAEFLYAGFQFRFASRSSEQGAVDMWHLDYVSLDANTNVTDLAIAELPGFLLAPPFTAIPYRHLNAGGAGLLTDSLIAVLRAFGADNVIISPDSEIFGRAVNGTGGSALPSLGFTATGAFDGIGGETNQVPPGARSSDTIALSDLGGANGNGQQFIDYVSTQTERTEVIELVYDLVVNGEGPVYNDNNRASRKTSFENYMAYDDGSAEVTIEGQQGTTILQRYQAYVADELTGIQIRIPRGLGGLGAQDLRLVVYTGEDQPTDLVYQEDFDILYAEEFFTDSLEGYTTYIFDTPVNLTPGQFYVGWEQQRANRDIGVGFDRNTQPPVGEGYQWFNIGNGWNELRGSLRGAIMLRPLLAGFDGVTTSTYNEIATSALVDVFPNPTNGILHLRPRPHVRTALNYRLLGMTGAVLRQGVAAESLQLGDLPAGIYVLEVTDGTVSSRHKVVRR